MLDLLIKGGRLADGTGAALVSGDLGIRDGLIVEMGKVTTPARHTINADGALVTPGWVDVHTHYDGQVSWDDALEPSANHGVSTVVMGNCGVGFAPVPPGGAQELIALMEGVEDIPGSALSEGIPWGAWETFPQYLDYLGSRAYALDIAAQVPHGPVRNYVMGARGRTDEDATAEELAAMETLVEQALRAGAVGVSTSRTMGHRALSGEPVPGTFAAGEELMAFARAIQRAGHGVFEAVPANVVGNVGDGRGEETRTTPTEIALFERLSKETGCPVTFTLVQVRDEPTLWRDAFAQVEAANAGGAKLHPQVSARAVGMLTSLATYHMFQRRPSYMAIAHLPLPERLRAMRDPGLRARILAEEDQPDPRTGSNANLYRLFRNSLPYTWPLSDPPDYEPDPALAIGAQAKAQGRSPAAVAYDALVDPNGTGFLVVLRSNYCDSNLDAVRAMLAHPDSVTGLSDAGAHVNFIGDGSMPSFQLIHWCRDRKRGERLDLPMVVAKQTKRNADLYGFADRGVLAIGKRADVNVIDFDALRLPVPAVRQDLPAGGQRLVQGASGYVACVVGGVQTRSWDQDTGARPGRLLRGGVV